MSLKITGRLPRGSYLDKLKQSPNYKAKGFENLSETLMKPGGVTYGKMMREFFKKHPHTEPPVALPSVQTDLSRLNGETPVLVWFGHSSYFIRAENKNYLIDPVFSGNAAPFSFMVKAFAGSNVYRAEDMPEIDYLILTHDHYDHLDYKTVVQLKQKVKTVYCSLGVGAHLLHWGFDKKIITELDWWESAYLHGRTTLTATPARHFSGRTFKRGQSFWSSFVLQTPEHRLFLGGDSGYDEHFQLIGERFGSFDLAILEAGQYNTLWPYIHMMPEETVQAAVDLRAKQLLPVHWGKFKLSMHPWNEPVQRVLAKADAMSLPVCTPRIGEALWLNGTVQGEKWWDI